MKIKKRILAKVLMVLGMIALIFSFVFSCQPEDGIDGIDGIDGTPGQDGTDGEDGSSVVIKFRDATTDECPDGGNVIMFAYDSNSNGIFDDSDNILSEFPICNGQDGLNCWDLNQNGQEDASEDLNADGVVNAEDCQAGSVVYNIVAIPDGDERCGGNGGWSVAFGVDENDNDQLDGSEVRDTFTVCNGADGQDGADGLDGIVAQGIIVATETVDGCSTISFYYDNGATPGLPDDGDTLISTTTICDGSEGGSGQACWDLNGNSIGDSFEDLNGDGVVDILDCRGTDGQNGNTGDTPLITFTSTPFDTSNTCTDGGVMIQIFVDGVEDTSFEVCNGNQTESFIVYSIFQDPDQCGDKGGVQIDIYDDVDGDGSVNPNVDFFLESFTICMGMNAPTILAIGYELDDYVDLDIQVVKGSDSCPEDPNGSTITVYIESNLLISFSLCNASSKFFNPTVEITGVALWEKTSTSVKVSITTNLPSQCKIEYGLTTENLEWQTVQETDFLTVHSESLVNLQPNTTYYYRVYVEGEDGKARYGSIRPITTLP